MAHYSVYSSKYLVHESSLLMEFDGCGILVISLFYANSGGLRDTSGYFGILITIIIIMVITYHN